MLFELVFKSNMPLKMFILIGLKRTGEKGNWVKDCSPAVTAEPKQNEGAVTT